MKLTKTIYDSVGEVDSHGNIFYYYDLDNFDREDIYNDICRLWRGDNFEFLEQYCDIHGTSFGEFIIIEK